MKKTIFTNLKLLLILVVLIAASKSELQAQRDPYLRPFANNSIWNMAIHNNAVYVDAKMNAPTAWGVTEDEEIIILSPSSPNVGIYQNGWAGSARCDKGAYLTSAPIPDGWVHGIPSGGTPNASTAVLAQDGRTVINLQSLHRCTTTGSASALVQYPSTDLYTDGIQGGHGGSGMAALGGSIRVGELTPNLTEAQIKADPNIFIKHVIKMNVNTKLYVSNSNGGYRWPAVKADANYNSPGACDYYGGSVPQFKMGSLLAIPKNVNVETMGLQTGPGIMMARTLQKYGAYLVDATCWDVVAFETQTGPHGNVMDQFASKYGYAFNPQSTSVPWAQDIAKIVQELFIVDSNNASNIGGGPITDLVNRLAPAICDIGTPGSGIYDCGAVANVPVTGVNLNPTTASVAAGATTTLTATVAPSNATNKNVTWTSSNTAVATVSTAGVVTGVAAGTATITVTTIDGSKTATCAVTVTSGGGTTTGYEAESGTFGGGAQTQTASNASNGAVIGNLNAVGSFTQVSSVNGGSGGTASLVIRYSNGFSSTSAIGLYVNNTFIQNVSFPVTGGWNTFANVTVSINLPSGTANTIKLQIGSGNAAADIDKYTVTPSGTVVSVTGVSLTPTTASVAPGATTTLTATVAPANATNKNVTWSSSNTAIATISTAGVVTGVATGTATITVTTQDGNKTATSTITVTSDGGAKLSGTIIGTSGSWNNDTNVTRDKAMDGNLTTFFDGPTADGVWVGLDLGSAKVISKIKYAPRSGFSSRMNGGKFQGSSSSTFTSVTDLFTISASPTEGVLTEVIISNTTAFQYVRYLSPNTGYGNIAELEFYGPSSTSVPVTSVSMNPTTASIAAGVTTTLTATVAPTNATNKNVTWSSSNTAVATVSTAGVVTGVAAGSATVTVSTQDGAKTATCAVTVTSASAGSFKIMPLGDSKTEGGGGAGHQSWRGYLRAKLVADGKTINYVGPRANTANGDATPNDNDHAGFGGYSIGPDTQTFCAGCETTGIYEHIQDYFVAQNPDVVLVAIGVNDFFNAVNHPANYATTAPQRYQDLVNKILQLKPTATLVLGTVEPVRWDQNWGGNPSDGALGTLNQKIKDIANASATDKIYLADIRAKFMLSWSTADYYDDVHLNQQGATKVANAWYDALLPILSGTTPPADTQTPSVPTSLTSSNITSSGFTVSWTASTDNVGVTGYDIYRGGTTLMGSSTTTSYTATGLASSTAYSITVKAKDAAGNISAASTALSVTTSAGTATNLLTSNPSFESQTGVGYPNGVYTGITGWSLNNTAYNSIGVTSGSAQAGNNKLELNFAGIAQTLSANYASVTAGQQYTLGMALAKVSNTNTSVQSPIFFRIDWYNSSNVLISSSSSGNILGGGTSAWAIYSVTATAPTNATKAGCYVELKNTAYPNQDVARFTVDNVKLNVGSTVGMQATSLRDNMVIEYMAEGPSIEFYPNPVTGNTIHIVLNGLEGPQKLSIIDVSGRDMYQQHLDTEMRDHQIEIDHLKLKGLYIFQISGASGIFKKKIIIK